MAERVSESLSVSDLSSMWRRQKGLDSMSHGNRVQGESGPDIKASTLTTSPKPGKLSRTLRLSLQHPERLKQSQSPIPFHLLCSHWRSLAGVQVEILVFVLCKMLLKFPDIVVGADVADSAICSRVGILAR